MKQALGRVVVVDDDSEMRSLLEDFLRTSGYEVNSFESPIGALKVLESQGNQFDLVISDIRMPHMDGFEFVKEIKKFNFELPVVLITAFGSIESAIEAIRLGAYDYVVKPFQLADIQVTIKRAMEYKRLRSENVVLRKEIKQKWGLGDIIGRSDQMQVVFDLVKRVANANANVLIMGESGTGKEVIARAIHEQGARSSGPFVAINCTAIPESLLESELFGHAKGSFTGAGQRKSGLFEEANGGTLFLDEIGDMDPSLQAKLLRVIQERKIRAVGDTQSRDVDVRIIAATHKDLKSAIKDGRFREDLYYRLSVIPIQIPALRHRKKDIPLLAEHFLKKYSATNGIAISGLTDGAVQWLISQPWEGNVRELENVIERSVVLCRGSQIDVDDLPEKEMKDSEDFYANVIRDFPTIEELEKRYMQFILEKTGGRKGRAAQILGINRRTLYRKEREFGFVFDDGIQYEAEVLS